MNATIDKGPFLLTVDTRLVLGPLDLPDDLDLSRRLPAGLEADPGEFEAEEVDLEAGQQGTEVRAARVTTQQTHVSLRSVNTEITITTSSAQSRDMMSHHNMNILRMVQMTKSLIEISLVTSQAQGNVLSTMSKLETFIYVDNCAPYFLIDERYRRQSV